MSHYKKEEFLKQKQFLEIPRVKAESSGDISSGILSPNNHQSQSDSSSHADQFFPNQSPPT